MFDPSKQGRSTPLRPVKSLFSSSTTEDSDQDHRSEQNYSKIRDCLSTRAWKSQSATQSEGCSFEADQ
eukprot:8468584-Prorocentrum_lima.AAC.1